MKVDFSVPVANTRELPVLLIVAPAPRLILLFVKLMLLPEGYVPVSSNSAPLSVIVSVSFVFAKSTLVAETASSITTLPAAVDEEVTVDPVTVPLLMVNIISVEI